MYVPKSLLVGLCVAFLVIGGTAQTVTTTGGTTNTVPKFTGTTTIGNSAIVDNSGSVGVGTTTPNAKLNVSDSFAGNRDVLVVDNPNGAIGSGVTTAIRLDNGVNQMGRLFVRRDNNEFVIQNIETGSTAGITFQSGTTNIARFDSSGNFGIGTTSPLQKLDVLGNIRIGGTGNGLVFPNGTVQTTAAVTTGGTITGVTAGTGLTGGGTSGNVSLAVDSTVARNNTSQTFNGFVQANGAFSSFLGVNGALIGLVSNGVAGWFRNTNSVPGIGTGDLIQGHGVGSTRVFRVDNVGSVFTLNGYFTSGVDFAESIRVVGNRSDYQPGDVLVIAQDRDERFQLSSEPYSTLVAGVYSTKPGITASPHPVMGLEQLGKEVPLGVVGIVPTKANTENGPIQRGDLLVTSSSPGYVMKGTDRERMVGAVVGKALQPLNSGSGKILVLVSLQ